MPATLPPINRRQFLSLALAAGASAMLPRTVLADDAKPDPNYFALISDIHINADRQFVNHSPIGSFEPWANFDQASREVLALPKRPGTVLINGDIAAREGRTEDYATAMAAMVPLRSAGMPVHWALGNHDDRANLAQAAAPDDTLAPDLANRRVMILRAPLANIFVLDSLLSTNKTPGLLGGPQLAWLAAALDKNADRPAIVFVHHHPFLHKSKNPAAGSKWGNGTLLSDYAQSQPALEHAEPPAPGEETFYGETGDGHATAGKPAMTGALNDTLALLNILLPRKQVKAWFFGHTHAYTHKQIEGMHLVNLPATGWLFAKEQPLGWMDMQLGSGGATLQLHCLDANHPLQHDRLELTWRPA